MTDHTNFFSFSMGVIKCLEASCEAGLFINKKAWTRHYHNVQQPLLSGQSSARWQRASCLGEWATNLTSMPAALATRIIDSSPTSRIMQLQIQTTSPSLRTMPLHHSAAPCWPCTSQTPDSPNGGHIENPKEALHVPSRGDCGEEVSK